MFKRLSVVTLLMVLLIAVTVPLVSAQDDMMMGVTCDSDLILSLYVAEAHFNFANVHDMAMMGDDMGVDLSNFEYGQYASLFDSMMSMMDDSMMLPNDMGMDEAERQSMADMMVMSDEEFASAMMMDDSMMDDMAMLAPATIADEPAECTALRSELNRFYTILAYNDTMASEDAM
ncbi:MAG: hypothetical protein K8L99_25285 [Anaerolineae bacterium]|nr:hypothetical protein [Anaerolineae bacterium]